jgi:PAS domain S-box-containing protein
MIAGTYNAGLVALSVLIAMVAAYAAFNLGERVSASGGQRRWIWLTSGAVAMGFGIWSMHYVGMLAFVLPVAVLYHVPTVILSLVAAVTGAAIALYIVSKKTMRRVDTAIAGVCLGGAIVSMHYVGMAAMRSAAMHYYKPGLVTLSVVVAVTFSSLAAWLAFRFGRSHQEFTWTKLAAASLMGVGIASMHYSAMAAAYFMPGYAPLMRHTVEVSTLGAFGIGITTLLLLGTLLVTLWFDRRLANERLLQHLYGDLQEREAKIRRLVDANIIGIFMWNPEGKIIEANEAFLHMVAYGREDLVSGRLRWTDLTPAGWRDRDERAEAEVKANGSIQPSEREFLRKDGSLVPVLVGAASFEGSGNEGLAFVLDLSEQKRAEDALRASEQSFRVICDTVAGLIAVLTASGEVEFVNRQLLEYFGKTPDELKSWVATDAVHPDDLPRVAAAWKHSVETGHPYDDVHRICRADGVYRWFRLRAHPLRDQDGRIIRWYNLLVDVDNQKKAEEKLRQSEAYLAEAQRLTHTGSGAWGGPGFDALYLSDEWYRIYGFDPEQGLSVWKDRLQRMHPEDRAKVEETKNRAIREKSDYEVDHRIILPDGTTKYTHTVGHPVLNASGAVEQFVCTMMDVTERKQAEEAREALREARADLAHVSRVTTMGELTASLAHEIKQPIAAAIMDAGTCLEWLARDRPDIEEAREAASRIITDATRASEIINRIRLVFKKGEPQRESLDVNEVVREMIALLRNEAGRALISIRTELATDLSNISADRVQLQQVFMNLMLNAIDAMKEKDGGELTIKSHHHPGDQLLISVSDTGTGLPPRADKIFDAFFTTKPQGTGMGLSISRSIIESHGGRLWATANSGRGATFQFTLPSDLKAAA